MKWRPSFCLWSLLLTCTPGSTFYHPLGLSPSVVYFDSSLTNIFIRGYYKHLLFSSPNLITLSPPPFSLNLSFQPQTSGKASLCRLFSLYLSFPLNPIQSAFLLLIRILKLVRAGLLDVIAKLIFIFLLFKFHSSIHSKLSTLIPGLLSYICEQNRQSFLCLHWPPF